MYSKKLQFESEDESESESSSEEEIKAGKKSKLILPTKPLVDIKYKELKPTKKYSNKLKNVTKDHETLYMSAAENIRNVQKLMNDTKESINELMNSLYSSTPAKQTAILKKVNKLNNEHFEYKKILGYYNEVINRMNKYYL